MISSTEESNVAIAILEIGRAPKVISYFGGTNNTFVNCTSFGRSKV